MSFLSDLRFAIRMLLKSPGFTMTCIAILALGGASTAVFNVVNSVLLRPLPFPGPDRLVQVWLHCQLDGNPRFPFSYPDFADWNRDNKVFDRMALYRANDFTMSQGGHMPVHVSGAIV